MQCLRMNLQALTRGWLRDLPTVAGDQYYCPTVVDQDVQTLDALVAAVQVLARR